MNARCSLWPRIIFRAQLAHFRDDVGHDASAVEIKQLAQLMLENSMR